MVEKMTDVSAYSKYHPSRNVKIKTCLKGSDKRHSLARNALVVASDWHIKKVVNMSTMIREWQALQSLPLLPFRNLILNPMPPKVMSKKDVSAVPVVEKMFEQKLYNDSQLQAIVVRSLEKRGFIVNLLSRYPYTLSIHFRTLQPFRKVSISSEGHPGQERPRPFSASFPRFLTLDAVPSSYAPPVTQLLMR
jgi:hypothetical protein